MNRPLLAAVMCLAAVLSLAGCADDTANAGSGISLRVLYSPGGADTKTIVADVTCAAEDNRPACAALRDVIPDLLLTKDTRRNEVCTMVYGGPEVARIHGTAQGDGVDITLNRTNGCEMHRWDTVMGPLSSLAPNLPTPTGPIT